MIYCYKGFKKIFLSIISVILLSTVYLDSPKFIWTSVREGISAATDLNQFLKIISDAGFETDITYQDAVDTANVAFVQKLLVSPEYSEVVNWAGNR